MPPRLKSIKTVTSVVLLLIGVSLFFVQTDREMNRLRPTEGIANSIPLSSTQSYQQAVLVSRPTITRVSFFLRSLKQDIPAEPITVEVFDQDTLLGQSTINATAIDNKGATEARFNPPLELGSAKEVTLTIQIPPTLDGSLRTQLRRLDDSIDPTTVTFTIDGEVQPDPMAYQLQFSFKPPLSLQFGGMLIIAGLVLLGVNKITLFTIAGPFLYAAPALLTDNFSILIVLASVILFFGMFKLLSTFKLSTPAIFAGANAVAFTSWYPLQQAAGREYYAVLALIPYLLYQYRLPNRSLRKIALVIAATLVVVLVLGTWNPAPLDTSLTPASIKDTFSDPLQHPLAVKTDQGDWTHFGAYLGIMNLPFLCIGLIWKTRRYHHLTVFLALSLIIITSPVISLFGTSSVQITHFSLLIVLAASFFIAWGVEGLQQFLLSRDQAIPARFITVMITTLVILAMFDLWQVSTSVFDSIEFR